MTYEPSSRLDFMNTTTQYDSQHDLSLKQHLFINIKEAGQVVLDTLFRNSKELLVRLTLELTEEEERLPNEECWEVLKEDIKILDEEIANALIEHSNSNEVTFVNHLKVEAYRKFLFIKCCKIKMNLEALKQRLKLLILSPESNLSIVSRVTPDIKRTRFKSNIFTTSFLSFDSQENDTDFSNRPSEYFPVNDELLATPQ